MQWTGMMEERVDISIFHNECILRWVKCDFLQVGSDGRQWPWIWWVPRKWAAMLAPPICSELWRSSSAIECLCTKQKPLFHSSSHLLQNWDCIERNRNKAETEVPESTHHTNTNLLQVGSVPSALSLWGASPLPCHHLSLLSCPVLHLDGTYS